MVAESETPLKTPFLSGFLVKKENATDDGVISPKPRNLFVGIGFC
jgi:hypothetical protein